MGNGLFNSCPWTQWSVKQLSQQREMSLMDKLKGVPTCQRYRRWSSDNTAALFFCVCACVSMLYNINPFLPRPAYDLILSSSLNVQCVYDISICVLVVVRLAVVPLQPRSTAPTMTGCRLVGGCEGGCPVVGGKAPEVIDSTYVNIHDCHNVIDFKMNTKIKNYVLVYIK